MDGVDILLGVAIGLGVGVLLFALVFSYGLRVDAWLNRDRRKP